MTPRPLLLCLVPVWLTGCQWLPVQLPGQEPREPVVQETDVGACFSEIPDFDEPSCMFEDWVAFGLASQRGDRAWRDAMLLRLEGKDTDRRLARAVVLAWGDERQWDQASELFKADLSAAPARLQPLLRYWLNEVEGRRGLNQRLSESRQAQDALAEEKAALEEKLDALTDIERNINSRQQTE
ncbi:hypothetical protein [Halomonas organivorans]|uniref:YfhG lipoprotein n=1 Tax=Halomonas organivorans TaxID=257772 RepID=A0A7W5G666_9GAMM|nr:hypothetical protein [Halomonas organivorans]MBB3141126.1 hypothetical protein [Halomonas organivorans]